MSLLKKRLAFLHRSIKSEIWKLRITERNKVLLPYHLTGRELQRGSIFVLRFFLLTYYIGIYDSKYPKANNKVESSVMIGICG